MLLSRAINNIINTRCLPKLYVAHHIRHNNNIRSVTVTLVIIIRTVWTQYLRWV